MVLLNRFRSRLLMLVRSEIGATMPEYAILGLVVLAMALVGLELVGRDTQQVFQRVQTPLASHHAESFEVEISSDSAVDQANSVAHGPAFDWTSVLILVTLAVILCSSIRRIYRSHERVKPSSRRNILKDEKTEPNCVFEKRQRILRVLSNDADALMEGRIEVRHLMTKNPERILPSQDVSDAVSMMEERKIDYLLVCDKEDELVGLLSHHFLRKSQGTKVQDVMLTSPPFVESNSPVSTTITQMVNQGISCLAVLEGSQVVGVLTSLDIQLTLQCALQLLYRSKQEQACGELDSVSNELAST